MPLGGDLGDVSDGCFTTSPGPVLPPLFHEGAVTAPVFGYLGLALTCGLYFGLNLRAASGVEGAPDLAHVPQHPQAVRPGALSRVHRLRLLRPSSGYDQFVAVAALPVTLICLGGRGYRPDGLTRGARDRLVLSRRRFEVLLSDLAGFTARFHTRGSPLSADSVNQSPRHGSCCFGGAGIQRGYRRGFIWLKVDVVQSATTGVGG